MVKSDSQTEAIQTKQNQNIEECNCFLNSKSPIIQWSAKFSIDLQGRITGFE